MFQPLLQLELNRIGGELLITGNPKLHALWRPVIGNSTDWPGHFLAVASVWSLIVLWGYSCLQKIAFSQCRLKLAIVTKVTGGGEAGVCANSKLKASTSLKINYNWQIYISLEDEIDLKFSQASYFETCKKLRAVHPHLLVLGQSGSGGSSQAAWDI